MPLAFRQLATSLTRDFARTAAASKAPKPLRNLSKSVDAAASSLIKALHHKGKPVLTDIKEDFAELGVNLLRFLKSLAPNKLKPITAFLERLSKTKTQIQEKLRRVEARKELQEHKDSHYWKDVFPFDRLDSKLPNDYTKIAKAVDQAIPEKLKLTVDERNALIAFCLLHKEFGVEEIKTVTGLSQSSAYRYKELFDNNDFAGPFTDVKAKWFMLENQGDYSRIRDLAKAVKSFFNRGQATVYRWVRANQEAFPNFLSPVAKCKIT